MSKGEPSRFTAIVRGRCPSCRQGKVFPYPPYSLKFYKMNSFCMACGQDFEIEPGFYYGAMYFSYAITIILGIAVLAVCYYLLGDPPVLVYLSFLMGVCLLLSPISFRLSRLLMLHWFGGITYQPPGKK